MSACNMVRTSTNNVVCKLTKDSHVMIDYEKLKAEVKENTELYLRSSLPPNWEQYYHYCDDTDLTAQYVLVLSSINSCFWPCEGYEYNHLANTLKLVLQKDNHAFDSEQLMQLTPELLTQWLRPTSSPFEDMKLTVDIPLVEERCRLIREVGQVLYEHFDGKASNLIKKANKSAPKLVDLVTRYFPGFRDHANYSNGHQVFYYKRAQIFVGDIWGAYKGKGIGEFYDMNILTCFADYRLPQLLRHVGIMIYSNELSNKVDTKTVLLAGSEEEMQIRAVTVQVVEEMCKEISLLGHEIFPYQLDWLLWERGEALLNELPPHHRVLTTCY